MKHLFIMVMAMLLFCRGIALAQAVEVYAGHQRAGVDILWYKNFKNTRDERTPFLFFSRTRASTNYENALTAFGATNALSYNFKNGLGIVGVGSFLNGGFTPKAGIQYYKQTADFLFFGWCVADLKSKGNVDLFGLFRYQPVLSKQWKGFLQMELFPVYQPSSGWLQFTQRFRIGARHRAWAGGLMMDFGQSGKDTFSTTQNMGSFLRYDF